MQPSIFLVVYALAVARMTRLVTSDRITSVPRDWVISRAWRRAKPEVPEEDWHRVEPPMVAYLVTCPWCVSIYIAAAAALGVWLWGEEMWFFLPALALAFSHVTGLLATVEE